MPASGRTVYTNRPVADARRGPRGRAGNGYGGTWRSGSHAGIFGGAGTGGTASSGSRGRGVPRARRRTITKPGVIESMVRRDAGRAREPVRGRFAPTPNGPLHLGSVVAALASHLSARSRGGEWHVRIDDVDRARAVPGAEDAILGELERLGLTWDGPVVRQRDNTQRYRDALARLERTGRTFGCACTRREAGPGPYPGTCRAGTQRPARSIRMKADSVVGFHDAVQGEVTIDLGAETGDFIVYRADGVHAYHLAAAADDGALGVTEIVRGADLLAATGPQLHVQRALGLPAPAYAHVPVATTPDGAKLAKSSGAVPSSARPAAEVLRRALAFLGLRAPAGAGEAGELVEWGIRSFDVARIPRVRAAPFA